jgi:hypothetical protein|tara:strand:+ start:351 stop:539 length:189 start_codon:yes stop_codon:yes gene_type:complete
VAKRTQPYRFGVPAKYLEGLSDAEARKRAAEIKRTAKAYKAGKRIDTKKVERSRLSDKKKKR